MPFERDSRGHLREVSMPTNRATHHGHHSRPAGPSFDRTSWGDPGRASLPSGRNHFDPRTREPEYYPREPEYYPPARDPPRNVIPEASPWGTLDPAQFDERRGIRRSSEELYEEAFWDVSPNEGTDYPCTQRDLDACGGNSRGMNIRDAAGRGSWENLLATFFPQPNTRPKVSVKKATLDIYQHNDPERIPSAKEVEAIDRLCNMLTEAYHGFWGPDVAIKCFCDLDTVFFRGKLKEHVCITWAGLEDFADPATVAYTGPLGSGKALIKLNAWYIFIGSDDARERPLNETLATILHEMW